MSFSRLARLGNYENPQHKYDSSEELNSKVGNFNIIQFSFLLKFIFLMQHDTDKITEMKRKIYEERVDTVIEETDESFLDWSCKFIL